MKNRIAIYRCMFSDYDVTLSELKFFENIDYYFFTDNPNLEIYPYKTILVSPQHVSPSLDNRFIKIIVPEILKTYDVTLYIDTNIAIVGNIQNLIDKFMISECDIGLFSHPYHDNLENEVRLCIDNNKSNKKKLMNELEYYADLGFSESEKFSDNSIIFRKKHDLNMKKAMQHWFDLVKRFSGRDQISLPTIRSQYNLKEFFFDFSPRTPHNKYFIVFPHKEQWKVSSIIKLLNFYARFLVKIIKRKLSFYRSRSGR